MKTNKSVDERLTDIFKLVLKINRETKYPAFFEYSGHVEYFYISIGKNKEEYWRKVAEYRVWMNHVDDIDSVLGKIENELRKILEGAKND